MKVPADKFARQTDWNLLKVFLEVVLAGGVTRAASSLSRQQPAISLSLRRLEERLGVTLCKRGPRGFRLTDEGQLVAETCQRLFELVQEIPGRVEDVAAEVRGRVRIKLISNLINANLDEAIARFHGKYPRVEIIVDVGTWSEVVDALLHDDVDIGLASMRSQRAELSYQVLFREVHHLYCGRSHPLFGRKVKNPSLIANQGFILTSSDEPDELTDFRLKHGLGRVVAGRTEHLEEARRLAILGVGLCFLPLGLVEADIRSGKLWSVLTQNHGPSMEVFMMTNPDSRRHMAAQLFIDELSAQIGV